MAPLLHRSSAQHDAPNARSLGFDPPVKRDIFYPQYVLPQPYNRYGWSNEAPFLAVSYRLLVLFLALSLSSFVDGLLFSAKLKIHWTSAAVYDSGS